MTDNVQVAAYDEMIDALSRFDRRTAEIGEYLGRSAQTAKSALNNDAASCLLERRVTAIGSKMLLVMDRSKALRNAMEETRDALIRLRQRTNEEA